MSNSLSIHSCTNVRTRGVAHHNVNAITLTVSHNRYGSDCDEDFEITLFGLPAHVADGLEKLLGGNGIEPAISDAEALAKSPA